MKKYRLLFSIIVLFHIQIVIAQQEPIEIIESIPDETTLDNPEIRNTREVWLEVINEAKSSLDIETFYISHKDGEPLGEILQAIVDAAKRGVKVRIISDSKFYKTYPQNLDELKKEQNIAVRIINFNQVAGGIMHAKYFIIDGKITFLGSQNFDWRAMKHVHEIGVVLRNEQLSTAYLHVFNMDWDYCESRDRSAALSRYSGIDAAFPVAVQLTKGVSLKVTPTFNPTGFIPDEKYWDEQAIVRLIDGASKEICIQVLSYNAVGHDRKTYYEVLELALRRAAARGVKVKLIASDWSTSKPKIDYLKSLTVVPNIDVKITTIPVHSSGFITFARVEHCKYMVVDNAAVWVGTSNWEKDYFYNSRNVGVVIEGAPVAVQLRNVFRKSWESKYAQSVRPEQKYTPPKRDNGSGE